MGKVEKGGVVKDSVGANPSSSPSRPSPQTSYYIFCGTYKFANLLTKYHLPTNYTFIMTNIPANSEKIVDRFSNYSKALAKLSEIHLKNISEIDEITRDAYFQRYEFTIELAWKLVKDILEFEQIVTKTPRESIKEAVKANILSDFYIWDEMLTTRNYSSHNYDEQEIQAIFPKIYNQFYPELISLQKYVSTKYKIRLAK